jgi:hypothetical protein
MVKAPSGTHPAQLGVFGALQTSLSAVPRRDDEDVISRLPMLGWKRLRQDGDFLEGARGVSGCFTSFTMSTDHLPDAGIEGSIGRASGEQYPISSNQ